MKYLLLILILITTSCATQYKGFSPRSVNCRDTGRSVNGKQIVDCKEINTDVDKGTIHTVSPYYRMNMPTAPY